MIPTIRITHPTLVGRPFHRAGWIYEEKVDGWRMMVYKDGSAVKLVSRNGRDHAKRFPAIVAAIRAMAAPTLVLDGEARKPGRCWRQSTPPTPAASSVEVGALAVTIIWAR